jgi:hypothetical protein
MSVTKVNVSLATIDYLNHCMQIWHRSTIHLSSIPCIPRHLSDDVKFQAAEILKRFVVLYGLARDVLYNVKFEPELICCIEHFMVTGQVLGGKANHTNLANMYESMYCDGFNIDALYASMTEHNFTETRRLYMGSYMELQKCGVNYYLS